MFFDSAEEALTLSYTLPPCLHLYVSSLEELRIT